MGIETVKISKEVQEGIERQKNENIRKFVFIVKKFIEIDDEIHSAPEDERWEKIEERAKKYTELRRLIKLVLKLGLDELSLIDISYLK